MIEISKRNISDEFPCPYIPTELARNEYFFGLELNEEEIDQLLQSGWRKFGWYFFRPKCNNCQACLPLRVTVNDFKPSRSQRKVLYKNGKIKINIKPLQYREELYELYQKHSMNRFNQPTDKHEFMEQLCHPACPALLMEYFIDDKLVAAGFLDYGKQSLSSVYFIYDTDYEHFSLGVFGVLKEIELAKKMQLSYYYLGYWIQQNKSMQYKSNYYPHELMNWSGEKWQNHKIL